MEEKVKDNGSYFDVRYGGKYYWSFIIKKFIL
jgi:hypothetical protein